MKYRKKPVVVDAVQYVAGHQPEELAGDVAAGRVRYREDGTALIATLEGEMVAQPGDWIIRGIKGELYPCKPDIYAARLHNPDGSCGCGMDCARERAKRA